MNQSSTHSRLCPLDRLGVGRGDHSHARAVEMEGVKK